MQSGNSRLARRRRHQRRVPKAADRPKLIASVGICYLGLAVLGVAVSLGDIHRWVEEQGIVYLRAINEVPLEMKRRLGAEYWIALDPGVCSPWSPANGSSTGGLVDEDGVRNGRRWDCSIAPFTTLFPCTSFLSA